MIKTLETTPENERMDLVFQFQQFMLDMIQKMQNKLSKKCNFTFYGSNTALEYGHIANLSNKLKNILYKIRVMALGYASTHGSSDLRACLYCGLVWSLVYGCQDSKTCGKRPPSNVVESKLTESTFSFSLDPFQIIKNGSHRLMNTTSSQNGAGCGKTIAWKSMTPVPIPRDFEYSEAIVSTEDVRTLPDDLKNDFAKFFNQNQKPLSFHEN